MTDVTPVSVQLQQVFVAALTDGRATWETAKEIAAAITTEAAWVSCLGATVDWLKGDPKLWSRAAHFAAIHLDPRLVPATTDPVPSRLLLRELMRASPNDAAAFIATIQDEQALYRLAPILPDLDLDDAAAVALVDRCASLNPEGESPAAASELSAWAAQSAVQARDIIARRLAAPDGRPLFHIWGIEPLVEGAMKALEVPEEERLAWRQATIATLLASPNPRRKSLAAYLACVAWPDPKPSERERHAAALGIAVQSFGEIIPAVLDAVMRDAWDQQEATFETLSRVVHLLMEAGLSYDVSVRILRKVANIASRGLGTLKSESIPDSISSLLQHVQLIPPTPYARDHTLDLLLDGILKRDRGVVKSFIFAYLRLHARWLLQSGLSFDEAFPLLTHNVGAGVLGTWLVEWMVDQNEALRTVAAAWSGTIENVRPHRAALAALTSEQAHAFIHVALTAQVRGEVVFALLNSVAEAREDVDELVRTTFLDELSVDYPGLTLRWVDETQATGNAAKPSQTALAAELRIRCLMRARLREFHEQVPELYATSPCYSAWWDIEQQINATQARAAEDSSFLAQLASRVHVARGEAMSHSLSREPVSFIPYDFSYEQRVRVMHDRMGLQQTRMRHFDSARELLSAGDRK
jgi:hypothetical protein